MYQGIIRTIYHWLTDCYVLSFPKCGRTWYRFMIGNTLVDHFKLQSVPLNDVLMVKDLHRYHNKIPRLIFTHDDLPNWKWLADIDTTKEQYKKKKVIFIIRDPRDLVVSNYYEKKYRPFKPKKGYDKKNFEGTISEFIRYEFGGLPNIIKYYNVWQDQMGVPKDYLLVRYEDLKKQPMDVLKQTMGFLGVNGVSEASLTTAVEEASFDRMRKIEESNVLNNYRLGGANADNPGSFKTRKGKVGSYKEELSPEDIQWMEDYIEKHLHPFYSYYKQSAEVLLPAN